MTKCVKAGCRAFADKLIEHFRAPFGAFVTIHFSVLIKGPQTADKIITILKTPDRPRHVIDTLQNIHRKL